MVAFHFLCGMINYASYLLKIHIRSCQVLCEMVMFFFFDLLSISAVCTMCMYEQLNKNTMTKKMQFLL